MSQTATAAGRPGAASRPFAAIIHGAASESADEQDSIQAAEAVAVALERLGHRAEIHRFGLDLSRLDLLVALRPAIVVNLIDALRGDGALFPLAPLALEHLDLPFTGAGAASCLATADKVAVKRALAAAGLPTPAFWLDGARPPAEATVIVKSRLEHASIGLDAASIVSGAEALGEIAAREARFGGRFFAEAYVDGREFNVALLARNGGAEVLPIPEIVFDDLPEGRPRIVDYDAKWAPESAAYRGTPRRFGLESAEPALAAELAALALECWRLLDLEGYARVDFRVGHDGRPTILEANLNPSLAPDAGFPAAAAEAGLSYDAMVARIVAAGVARGAR